jgi:hypothetical protein
VQQINVNCKACGFIGSAVEHDEELEEQALAGDEEETDDCPKCGAKLSPVEEARPEISSDKGVTTFKGSEESLDEEDR